MKQFPFLRSLLLAYAFGCICTAAAAEPVTLSFNCTGSTANDVSVNIDGAESVTASITNISHSIKTLSNSSIVCPDVNGNSSPNIELSISITGLTSEHVFNSVGLHIHALNSSGAYQQNNDNKVRKYNVSMSFNEDVFASFNQIDIAAGIPNSNKVWEAQSERNFAATSPLNLTLRISADASTNAGCFFGLESITLCNTDYDTPDVPDPTPDSGDSKTYTIKWKNNTESYMTEQPDGSIAIGDYGTFNKIFWEFIPTDNENCYYIRNTATGNYIGSCNMTPSSASKVSMSETPVEYYVSVSASTGGENSGCYWLSSTDCAGYDNETSSARCLNKDGASSNIITWTTGLSNYGSYWTLTESEDLYEIKPFTSSPVVGNCVAAYHIMNTAGEAYSSNGSWVAFDVASKAQQWYFVGTSNATGGYKIVSALDDKSLNNGTKYQVDDSNGSAPYHFIDAEEKTLDLSGVSDITFVAARSGFVLANQIYKMPCGSTGNVYIKKATIGNDLKYPMGKYQNKKIVYSSATVPTNKYVLLSRDMADVTLGEETQMTLTLNRVPGDYKIYLYLDWNRDGYFESATELVANEKAVESSFEVPSDAVLGKTRARIRITDNGLEGADDDTHGQVLDLLLNVTELSAEVVAPVVRVNAEDRGIAVYENGFATATPKGNSTFLYWSEGHRILSVESMFEVAESAKQRILTAFFTPSTDELDGIDAVTLSNVDSDAQIVCEEGFIVVHSESLVKAIVVFATNGEKVAGTNDERLSIDAITSGVYIVKAVTDRGVVSAKFKL